MLNYDYCQISDWLEGKLVSRSWLPNIGPEDILISLWSRVHICTSDYLQTLSCPSVTPVLVAGCCRGFHSEKYLPTKTAFSCLGTLIFSILKLECYAMLLSCSTAPRP